MKKALRDAWVKALRSGEYKQGKYRLRTDSGGFCCLGVLCEITDSRDMYSPLMREMFEGPYSDHANTLVSMNDREEKTFAEIADWIEANIPVTP